ncbi:pyridoxamine 5'-phosphate oxidase family protein [Streptomyces sp. TP-A0356]|uniref:pyridoxamine 5'-phosphate oxidase family protein n=1 Tax=Streptomyces sp. TP-A0356 TaxID=1359208 RepID=UPI0006E3F39B|nr:pyridoxamine 5'-phosphate oxidase family protein [Streptomyces sp. TP-A0356]
MYPNDGFRELERQECLRLLTKAPVGRVVHTRQALPAVLPLTFCLDRDGAVLLRTSAASELVRAIEGSVVAFEADDVDAAARSGWSVVVTGPAAVVTDPVERDRLARTGPRSWVPSPEDVFVRIEPELVTGRELVGGIGLYGVEREPAGTRGGADRPAPSAGPGPSGAGRVT